ncbi:hypothetical protein M407DRAFT_27951 [Tulasnella calospora MUT 4182]|uniref:F-box domain-containing protein n=1 Tax=Tulasnella calospora MUT 4182 TaxID=1051891 RepID=A0A0C3KMF9_9AGAM|nr:hypothetical protein M407DRAFT_27951 [Tulasnella calospora MUT 4182]
MTPSIKKLRCLNNALNIHHLPIELLFFIFECVLRAEATALMYYRQICTLSGVCARWLFTIHHSPQLWTNVAAIIKQEGLRKVLERSSDKLIDVEYDPPLGYGWRYGQPHFVDFLGNTSSANRRWRTLVLGTSYYPGDRPSDFLQFPAPNLERLVFKNDQGWDMEDVELFGGKCPNLKHIHLERAEFNWSQAAFKRLESLKLFEVYFGSVGPILDVIRDIPQLKTLEIRDCDVSEEVPANTQPVSLPNLDFLRAEFNNDNESTCATKEFLDHVSAPPRCSLYISLVDLDDEDSFVATFCEWLFAKQTKEVLEGLERFKFGFNITEDDRDILETFELFSGSANIKGGIRGSRAEDAYYVLEYIHGLFQRSHASKPFVTLSLSGFGVVLLNYLPHFSARFKDPPPITCLELVNPVWPSQNAPNEGESDELALQTASPFSTVRGLIFREACPDGILEIVLEALGDSQARTHSISQCRVENLDYVEIHVEDQDFNKAEAVVEILRNDPRIGKIDLYVAL